MQQSMVPIDAAYFTPNDARTDSVTPPSPLFSGQSVIVVDPMSRKLNVPIEIISETRAGQRIGIPSLCMLYLQGRCRQGILCHQVHADPSAILKLREQARQCLMCCATHGDPSAMPAQWHKYSLKIVEGSGNAIPMARIAFTQGLHRILDEHEQHYRHGRKTPPKDVSTDGETEIVTVPMQMICRLHGQDRCRFSEDCKFLHLCKDLLYNELTVAPQAQGRYGPNPSYMYAGNEASVYQPSYNRHAYFTPHQPSYNLSSESLISMDLTATPPMTPTLTPSHPGQVPPSPSIRSTPASRGCGDSWNYEPYAWNPFNNTTTGRPLCFAE